METATEKIIRLLLLYPKKGWKQAELAEKSGCSKAFVSKFTKRMLADGIIARPKPQEVVLLGNTKLLDIWCSLRKMPEPLYIKTKMPRKHIEKGLRTEQNYALTLFSAAWHRVKFMKTERTEVYVDRKKVGKFVGKFGSLSKQPTIFTVFPSGSSVFEGSEKINGLWLVHVLQNYADLISAGGTGVRVAHELEKKYNLRGV